MIREKYEEYLTAFNGRNYDKLLEWWAPNFSCMLGDKELFSTPAELKSFYGFLHDYADEEIIVDHYLSNADCLFLEVRVRITGRKEMSAEIIAESGFHTLTPIEKGMVIEMPQIIHYHLRDGKFVSAVCLISAPPTVSFV